jgi:hypothetical protein
MRFPWVHTNVFLELPKVLDEFRRLYDDVVDAFARGGTGRICLEPREPPGHDLWRALRQLADRALPEGHRVRPLYDLGVALGEYELALREYTPSPGRSHDLGALPDVRDLVRRAGQVPPEFLEDLPLLQSLAGLLPVLDRSGQAAAFGQYYASNLGHWTTDWPPDGPVPVRLMLDALVDHAERGLAEAAIPHRGASPERPARVDPVVPESDYPVWSKKQGKRWDGQLSGSPAAKPKGTSHEQRVPEWDANRGRLQVGDQDARRVKRTGAENVRKILDAFEKAGWPVELENPLADPHLSSKDEVTLHEAVRSLNDGLSLIRFHVSDSGTMVWWDFCPPKTP